MYVTTESKKLTILQFVMGKDFPNNGQWRYFSLNNRYWTSHNQQIEAEMTFQTYQVFKLP